MAIPSAYPQRRAPRVQLNEPLPATLVQGGRKRIHGKLQSVSVAGGLLSLSRALVHGDLVEVAFQTRSGPVHGLAEMLTPIPGARDGALQAFRLIALGDEAHRALCALTNAVSVQSARRNHLNLV